MVGKKPAKVASNEKAVVNLIGSPILYVGVRNNPYVCPACGRKKVKGFLYEEKQFRACSRKCLAQVIGS